MKKVLIIGGGPAGCAIAHQISLLKGYEILVVEKSAVLGGGCKTLTMGGHPYTFGPRHFITDKKYLFDFLNKYVPMRSCAEHEFRAYIEQDNEFFFCQLILHFFLKHTEVEILCARCFCVP